MGIWPGFVRSVHGALFADIGHAWTAPARAADVKVAAGVELGTSVVVGYSLPLSVTVGAGVGRDGARPEDPLQRRLFVRVGAAF